MIELTPNTAFMLYLCLTLFLLLGIWAFSHFVSKRQPILPPEHHLYVCEYCHFAYLDETCKQVTKCPQCQAFNKNNIYRGKT